MHGLQINNLAVEFMLLVKKEFTITPQSQCKPLDWKRFIRLDIYRINKFYFNR